MAVVEDIELRVTVNGTAAQKGLDDTRKAAESMGGRIGSLGEAMKGFQQKLGPAAAAISGVSTALGQTNGEAGKALAAIGQVAAAFAAGGPFGAALAAGTFAVDALSQSWERQIKAQDAALASIYKATDGYIKNLQTARGELEKARGEFTTAVRGGRELTPEERKQQLRDEAAGRIAAAEAAAKQARAAVDLAKAQATADEFGTTFSQERALMEKVRATNIRLADKALDQEREALQTRINAISVSVTMSKKAEEERGQNDYLADSIADVAAQQRAAATAARERNKAEAEMRAAQRSDPTLSFRSDKFKQREDPGKAAEDALQADIDRWATGAKAQSEYERIKTEVTAEEYAARDAIRKEDAAKEKALQEQRMTMLQGYVEGITSTMVAGTQTFIDDVITGQEHATERFISFIMKQAGQSLIGSGIKLMGEGIANTALGNPMGIGQTVIATSLIGSGVALGGIATGITHAAAGGEFGKPPPANSTSGGGADMAARARPARPGTAGAGGTNLTIIYGGLSGPSADDGARALGKGLERARRRGIV